MFKRWIVTLCLLMLAGMPAAAQDTPPEVTPEQEWILTMVETVEVIEQDAQPALLIGGTLTGTCEPVDLTEVTRAGEMLFVDLYRTLNPGIRCFAAETPFEITVPVPELLELSDDELPHYLIVNDTYFIISIAQIESITPPPVPPIRLLPLFGVALEIADIALESASGVNTVHVAGPYSGPCNQAFVRVRRDPQDHHYYFVEAFALINPLEDCKPLPEDTSFEYVQTLEVTDAQPITLTAGEQEYVFMPVFELAPEPRPDEQTFRSLHTINSVDVLIRESAPPQYVVHVEGYQPDGCTYPVEVEQSQDGNNIRIQIFRVMPIDVLCTMMIVDYQADIVLEGTFAAGTYTLDVNGVSDTFQAS